MMRGCDSPPPPTIIIHVIIQYQPCSPLTGPCSLSPRIYSSCSHTEHRRASPRHGLPHRCLLLAIECRGPTSHRRRLPSISADVLSHTAFRRVSTPPGLSINQQSQSFRPTDRSALSKFTLQKRRHTDEDELSGILSSQPHNLIT